MKLQIVAIYDRKIEAHMNPFFTPTVAAGVRAFQDGLTDTQTPMHKHPEDYELHHLGTWEDNTGRFTNEPEVRAIALGSDHQQKE